MRKDLAMEGTPEPYYGRDLALVHHQGFSFHADRCAPGILELLEPVGARGGLVLELGCGSGLLTKYLIGAGYRVIATDASPAMLDLAREVAPGADIRELVLPDAALPAADAIVSIGHVLSYLPNEASITRALEAIASALRSDGVLAIDICDLEWGEARRGAANLGRVGDDWAIVTEFSAPSPNRFVREMTTFVPAGDGCWRRGHERHDNVLIDTRTIPSSLGDLGVEATVGDSFGNETLPVGLKVVRGRKRS